MFSMAAFARSRRVEWLWKIQYGYSKAKNIYNLTLYRKACWSLFSTVLGLNKNPLADKNDKNL